MASKLDLPVDFDEPPRHFFGSINQRVGQHLVYPFFANELGEPAAVLLRFRASRIDSCTTLIENQKKLCKELQANANTSAENAEDFLYAVDRLFELVNESVNRANVFDSKFMERPEFASTIQDAALLLRDSKETASNQIKYILESCAKARDLRLNKQSIDLVEGLKNKALSLDLDQCKGYVFANTVLSKAVDKPDNPS